jgi:hypothetical protein
MQDDEQPEPESPLKSYVRDLLILILLLEVTGSDQQWRWRVEEFLLLSAILAADRIHQQIGERLKMPEKGPSMGWLEFLAMTPWVGKLTEVLSPLAAEMSLEAFEKYKGKTPTEVELLIGNLENSIYHVAQQATLHDAAVGSRFTHVMYRTRRDNRVRDEPGKRHRTMEGFIAPRSDPIWKKIRPLNGHGCRCTLEFILDIEAARFGLGAKRHWPNEEAKHYYQVGEFPDNGFQGPKFWIGGAKQSNKGAA